MPLKRLYAGGYQLQTRMGGQGVEGEPAGKIDPLISVMAGSLGYTEMVK